MESSHVAVMIPRPSAVRTFPFGCGRNAPILTPQQLKHHLNPTLQLKPKSSALRDFPYGCGRNALPITREECINNSQKTLTKFPSKKRKLEYTHEVEEKEKPKTKLQCRDIRDDHGGRATILKDNAPELSFLSSAPPSPSSSSSSAREGLKEILKLYHKLCKECLGESNSQGRRTMAYNKLKKMKEFKKIGPVVGMVTGIRVGDRFRFRLELGIVGLHRPLQAGIDYFRYDRDGVSIAISIVVSGGYQDNVDEGDVLIYTGHGKNNGQDQKLELGNLALKNSMDMKVPVRVVRGREVTYSHENRIIYTFDGLYNVESYNHEPGASGYLVYKFLLRRLPGQLPIP